MLGNSIHILILTLGIIIALRLHCVPDNLGEDLKGIIRTGETLSREAHVQNVPRERVWGSIIRWSTCLQAT